MPYAGRLEKLLRAVERETFQHLQQKYSQFLASPEYVLMVARARAQESTTVCTFRKMGNFMTDALQTPNSLFVGSLDDLNIRNRHVYESKVIGKIWIRYYGSNIVGFDVVNHYIKNCVYS